MAFGQNCNVRYRTEMEEIFTFLEDMTKRLSRPIKDLDDIRHAMGGLKEIRDREIMIDMSIGPIEVEWDMKKRTWSIIYSGPNIARMLSGLRVELPSSVRQCLFLLEGLPDSLTLTKQKCMTPCVVYAK